MSDTDKILAEVREAFKASFGIEPQTVSLETSAKDVQGWDSVGHLSLASNLEQTFNISLDVDEMMEMENVREIVRIIQAKLAKEADMVSALEWNFAERLVQRLGPSSSVMDAATGHSVGAEDLSPRIRAHGRTLLSAGLKKGDRVLIGCSLSPASALAYLGTICAGLVAVPVEERALTASPRSLLEATGAKAIWTEQTLPAGAVDDGAVTLLHGDLSGEAAGTTTPVAVRESDLAALMATSGSTGVPRFVMVSHGNLIANTEAIIRSQQLAGEDRAMLILPLNYCFGTSVLHTHLYAGGSVVLDRRFMFPDKVLRAIAYYGCTTFAGVPTAYQVLLRRSNVREMLMPSLRRLLQACGRLAPDKIREMRAALPATKFFVMYGQTEATARISCLEPEDLDQKEGSVGRPLDNVTVRVADEHGHTLPMGQPGELWVKGPSVSSGYWNNPAETGSVFQDGWLRTGDLARQDHEGYLWIEGRQGTFLKMRGIRVSFTEVEETVAMLAGVDECAARAVEHSEAGEALELFIVLEKEARLEEEHVRRHLPAHWALAAVHFVAELPKTTAGKIARASLPVHPKNLHAVAG